MTPPTPDELLRLARKAFPIRPEMGEDERDVPGSIEPVGHRLELCSAAGAQIIALPGDHPRRIEGLHALLLVLAGELDVAALLAERDRLRAEVDKVNDLLLDCEIERRAALTEASELRHGWDPKAGKGLVDP